MNKEKYLECVAKRICISCHEPTIGKVKCENCLQKRKQLEAARHAIGICAKCGKNSTENNRKWCKNCATKANLCTQKHVLENMQKGICSKCGQKAVTKNKISCKTCLEKARLIEQQRRAAKREQGVCYRCDKSATRGGLCDDHAANNKNLKTKLKIQRRAIGICEFCESPEIIVSASRTTSLCKKCFLKHMSSIRLGKTKRWTELEALFEKQNICPYTGKQLTIGVNASLDHIVPVSKGGSHDIINIQFVYCYNGFDVNRMKNDMTHDEFIEAIKTMALAQL